MDSSSDSTENPDLFCALEAALECCDLEEKLRLTAQLFQLWQAGKYSYGFESACAPKPIGEAGRPSKPELVAPKDLKRRRLGSIEGQAALLHAIAHIEFNAINLALDAAYRFRDLPQAYYADWIRIADEERYHFGLVRDHLQQLGFDYGDFPAHNGLWETAQKTAEDVLLRMALVPRILEARGLDVNPGIMEKLRSIGDSESVQILEIILRDEVGHVEAGTRWFRYVCEQRNLNPDETFIALVREHLPRSIRGPFYEPGRKEAGFTEWEMDALKAIDQENRQKP